MSAPDESYAPLSVIHFMSGLIAAGLDSLRPDRANQLYRLAFRLQNGSPGALKCAWAYDRGEISGEQLLELMD